MTQSHLMIANPFRGQGLASMFASHPPMQERIARLEGMARGPPGLTGSPAASPERRSRACGRAALIRRVVPANVRSCCPMTPTLGLLALLLVALASGLLVVSGSRDWRPSLTQALLVAAGLRTGDVR